MEVNQKLENEGWKVIRLWGKEIEHDSVQCAEKIKNMMEIR
jgi:very-short-patch-repair endonuclease